MDKITIDRETLADLIAQHLRDTYHCTRVWSAWQVGTMGEDDFCPVDESDTPGEIADAVLAALAAQPAEMEPVALTDSYVQQVPDKCDRITWRNHYYSLPPTPAAPEPVARVRIHMTGGNAGIAWSAVPTDDAPLMRDGDLLYLAPPPAAVPPGMALVPIDPTPEMVAAYLDANTEYWRLVDEQPPKVGIWRNGTPAQATEEAYRAMIAAAGDKP